MSFPSGVIMRRASGTKGRSVRKRTITAALTGWFIGLPAIAKRPGRAQTSNIVEYISVTFPGLGILREDRRR